MFNSRKIRELGSEIVYMQSAIKHIREAITILPNHTKSIYDSLYVYGINCSTKITDVVDELRDEIKLIKDYLNIEKVTEQSKSITFMRKRKSR